MYVHIYHCWHLVLGEFKHVFKPILKPQVANRWFRTIVDRVSPVLITLSFLDDF